MEVPGVAIVGAIRWDEGWEGKGALVDGLTASSGRDCYLRRATDRERAVIERHPDAAEDDLSEIWATIATETSQDVATHFVAAMEATFQPLRHFPLSGPARDQFSPGLRVTFHGP